MSKRPPDPADRTLPTGHVGELAPNWYCRGWNGKRKKYCGQRAGQHTDHAGVGRCKFHGGRNQNLDVIVDGQRLKIAHPRLAALVEQFGNDADLLNILPQLASAKALFTWQLERVVEAPNPDDKRVDALMAAVDTISRVIYRVEKVHADNTISLIRIRLFMLELDAAIDREFGEEPPRRERFRRVVHAIRV